MPRPGKPEELGQGRECQNDHEKNAERPGSSHAGTPKHRERDHATGASRLCDAKTIIVVASGRQDRHLWLPVTTKHATWPALASCQFHKGVAPKHQPPPMPRPMGLRSMYQT